jgi:hypothetical protein
MNQRTSIFSSPDGVKGVDVSDFKPKIHPEPRPQQEEIDRAAQGSRFRSRDPVQDETVGRPSTKRQPLVYRTGRDVTLSVKTTAQTRDRFYELTVQQGWKVAEAFEQAVAALERELSAKAGGRDAP